MQIQPRHLVARRQYGTQLQLCVPHVAITTAWCRSRSSRLTALVCSGRNRQTGAGRRGFGYGATVSIGEVQVGFVGGRIYSRLWHASPGPAPPCALAVAG